jgi:Kef-type K+ transport system membrane component KefB
MGLILYLFLVGLELDLAVMKSQVVEAFAISLAGMVVPFALSTGVSYFLWITYMQNTNVSYGVFMLFLGVAMSITAFPVLARILGELRLFATPVGSYFFAKWILT